MLLILQGSVSVLPCGQLLPVARSFVGLEGSAPGRDLRRTAVERVQFVPVHRVSLSRRVRCDVPPITCLFQRGPCGVGMPNQSGVLPASAGRPLRHVEKVQAVKVNHVSESIVGEMNPPHWNDDPSPEQPYEMLLPPLRRESSPDCARSSQSDSLKVSAKTFLADKMHLQARCLNKSNHPAPHQFHTP